MCTLDQLFSTMNRPKIGSYSLFENVGQGSHAKVWKARDEKNQLVAIKQISLVGGGDALKRTYREIKLLQYFQNHPNIVTVLDVLAEGTEEKLESVCIVMELCQTDLHKLLKSSSVINPNFVKLFAFQLTSAIRAMHNVNIVHRDLKPQNILISRLPDSSFRLFLCDFGTGRNVPTCGSAVYSPERSSSPSPSLAYPLSPEDSPLSKSLPPYSPSSPFFSPLSSSPLSPSAMALRQTSLTRVTTPFYIAPEGILNKDLYSTSVDIWALGCIVAEMLKRHPLFEGRDRKHQLQLIVDFCGKPEDAELQEYPESTKKQFLNNYQACCSSSIEELFPRGIDDVALDFLKKLLVFNPLKRYTALQAYEHPYLAPLNTGVYKNYANPDIVLEDMEYAYETPEEEWKFRLWKEINHYQGLRPLDQPSE